MGIRRPRGALTALTVDHWRQAYGSGELAAGLPAQPARRTNDNAALGGGVSGSIAMVAGAGFEPAAFRL
jgi:hypothetical protein